MRNPILWALTTPKLEVIRARVPYPLFVAGVTFVAGLALAPILTLIPPGPAGRLPPLVAFGGIPLLAAASVGGLLMLSSFFGYLSGFRPYVRRWQGMTPADVAQLCARLRDSAQKLGFQIVWDGGERGFVGVHGMQLEMVKAVHSGKFFPLRVSLLTSRPADTWLRTLDRGPLNATMKLANRTSIFWDTGERARCTEVGEAICAGAGIEPAAFPVKTA